MSNNAAKEWLNKSWDKDRGIETIDYSNRLVLVHADVEEVSQALSSEATVWERNVLGEEIALSQVSLFVFRLQGQAWTEIVYNGDDNQNQSVLGQNWETILSQHLKTKVIRYKVSDTGGYIQYLLWQAGELLEEFSAIDDGRSAPNLVESRFFSNLRNLKINHINNIWRFAHQFFRDQDAFEPGISFNYFLNPLIRAIEDPSTFSNYPGASSCVAVQNNGFGLHVNGRIVRSAPNIERLDYLAFEPPLLSEQAADDDAQNDALAYNPVLQRGLDLLDEGQDQAAIVEFTQVINQDPNCVPAYAIRGNIYKSLGNRQAAKRDYQRAADLSEALGDLVRAETFRMMMMEPEP